jgi:hypothetical protein
MSSAFCLSMNKKIMRQKGRQKTDIFVGLLECI